MMSSRDSAVARRRRVGVAVGGGCLALLGPFLGLSTPPARAATPTGTIVGIGSKCLTNSGCKLDDGNAVVLSTCNGSVGQTWTVPGDGTIRNQGHCLAVPGSGAGVTTKVHLWTCDAKPGQIWTARSDGTYLNPNSGLCLADSNSNTTDGNPIWLYTRDGKPAQVWRYTGASSAPSGAAMPTGDLGVDGQGPRGWKQIFTDDFTTSGKASSDGGLPDGKWWGYGAGTKITNSSNGYYDSGRTVSVANGVLTYNLHSENGRAYAAVESPMISGSQTYGRYDVRYRYQPGSNIAGFKSVWMTWPDDDHWGEGESDFNEYGNEVNRTSVGAFVHHACGNDDGCDQDTGDYSLDPTAWHTATEIWSPGKVTCYVDGHLITTSTTQVPSTPMHLLLQTEASSYGPQAAAGAVMKIDVDWVAVYTRK